MERRWPGLVLLAAGAALELVGAAVEVWQDRGIYTTSSVIMFPAFLVMVVGVALLSRGYRSLTLSLGTVGRVRAGTAAAAVGIAIWVGAVAWQLDVGLPSGNLGAECLATGALLFVGVALVAGAVAALGGSGAAPAGVAPVAPGGGSTASAVATPLARRPWAAATLAGGGAVLLGVAVATLGWSNSGGSAASVVHLLVTVETAWTGAWWLLVGYYWVLRDPTLPRRGIEGVSGLGVGSALVASLVLGWPSSTFASNPDLAASLALALSGLGLLALVLRLRAGPPAQATDASA